MQKINNLKELEFKMEKNKYDYGHPREDQRDILLNLAIHGYIYAPSEEWKNKDLILTNPKGIMICYLTKKKKGEK
ncbi:hypothetical protein HCJ46_17175 [Listeria booriae]|uniref:hypothetical protein n=1 Tax=Listeria booriae TaxID=1552123 RepID=UPI001623862C|nr:hypothetical protein [Listeria booriae]MBC1920486.1 hypothetical protein [Listeria booriae]